MAIEAVVMLRGADQPAIGGDRIRLLEAVAREGSISAGAKAVGLTYKAAWDAIEAMTNLFGKPLLATRAGGRDGGGASLTTAGRAVVRAFRRLEVEMARVARALGPELAGAGITPAHLVSGLTRRTSARNALRGTVTRIAADALTAEVAVAVSDVAEIHALITTASLRDLGLREGLEVTALVKAPFVMIAPGETPPSLTVRNCVRGVVRRCETTAVSAEIVLDIGGERTLAAAITARSVDALGLAPDMPAFALFDSAHVILAVD